MKEPTFYPNRYLMQPSRERAEEGIKHFTTFKLRDPRAIERIKGLPKGTLIKEAEFIGLRVVTEMVRQVSSMDQLEEVAPVLALVAAGTGPYHLNGGNKREVMNRYVPLPKLARVQPPSTEQLLHEALLGFETATSFAGSLVAAHTVGIGDHKKQRIIMATGKEIASASFKLACAPLGDFISDRSNGLSGVEIQTLGRDTCMQAVQDAISASVETGTFVSVAQLAEKRSPLAIAFDQTLSDEFVTMYDRGLARAV